MSVLSNYGLSSDKFESRLRLFRRFVRDYGVPATFACPSSLLSRSPELVKFLGEFDVAIHGAEHIDYKKMDRDAIEKDLNRAVTDYEGHNLKPTGFRAPFLRWSNELIGALGKFGLKYDSSNSVFWDAGHAELASRVEISRLLDYYSTEHTRDVTSLPRTEAGIVRIPVSLPDDEIIIVRAMTSHPDDIFAYWVQMLERAYEKSELLVIQIHPERFQICEEALGRLLMRIRERNIWTASLEEIASWWTKRNAAEVIVDDSLHINYENPDGLVLKASDEIKEQGDVVPGESFIRIPESHPLHQRARELGFVMSEDPSLGVIVDQEISGESELVEFGKKKGLVQKSYWPHNHRSAFCLTGDIDALTVGDFLKRPFMRMSSNHRRGV